MTVQGTDSRDQLRVAADASNEARKQVIRALKEAKAAWLQVRPTSLFNPRKSTRARRVPGQRRRNVQDIRDQSQQLKREVHQAKQELREEIRQQVKEAKRAAKDR